MSRRREGRDLPEVVARLFERARAEFPEPRAVNRTLVELCRLYDPVAGGPLMEHGLRRLIVEQLEQGRAEEAVKALMARFDRYRATFGQAQSERATPERT